MIVLFSGLCVLLGWLMCVHGVRRTPLRDAPLNDWLVAGAVVELVGLAGLVVAAVFLR